MNHILAAVTSQNGQLHITFVPSIVAGKLMIVGTCRSHRGSDIQAAELVLLKILTAASMAKSVITEIILHLAP